MNKFIWFILTIAICWFLWWIGKWAVLTALGFSYIWAVPVSNISRKIKAYAFLPKEERYYLLFHIQPTSNIVFFGATQATQLANNGQCKKPPFLEIQNFVFWKILALMEIFW